MNGTPSHIDVGDLAFEVRRSAQRRTVGITVDRAGELILHLPDACPVEEGVAFVEEKRLWVYEKLAEKERLYRTPPPKRYVSGEGHLYLGRSYRLRLVAPHEEGQEEALRLWRGRFCLRSDERACAAEHFQRWYADRGTAWIGRRVRELAPRVGAEPKDLHVGDLGYRWGSCTPEGRLLFHWRTVLLPAPMVVYVVAHELTHLLVPHHGQAFWDHLSRVLPDYEARRQWLAENGATYA